MKLISYTAAGRQSYGILLADGVVDLGRRLSHASLRDALGPEPLDEIRALAATTAADYPMSEVQLLTPVPDAHRILCIGRNYRGHVSEMNASLPKEPAVFARMHSSFVGSGTPLVRPRLSIQFDYEGELAVVIGKPGRRIAREDSLAHVAGYTCLNDGSIRDVQTNGSLFAGKNFYRSGSIGPCIVTSDEIADPGQLTLVTRLNGTEMQRTRTDDLIFDIPFLISYISGFTPLSAGDIIATGSPAGVGASRKPPVWMKKGDLVEVEISTIGVLANSVVDE